MSKQTAPIIRSCQYKDCVRNAVIGTYTWAYGATDVDLDRPLKVFCGWHKPKLRVGWRLRNIRLRRESSVDDRVVPARHMVPDVVRQAIATTRMTP